MKKFVVKRVYHAVVDAVDEIEADGKATPILNEKEQIGNYSTDITEF